MSWATKEKITEVGNRLLEMLKFGPVRPEGPRHLLDLAVWQLQRAGLAKKDGDRIELTDEGRAFVEGGEVFEFRGVEL